MQKTLWFLAAALLLTPPAWAGGWPKDYVVAEGSTSPDGGYGVLVPPRGAEIEDDDAKNYLVEIPKHRVVGQLTDANYIEGRNHRSMAVVWAPDASWCIVEVDGRFGFDTIAGVEILDGRVRQTALGPRVAHDLGAAMGRHSHGEVTSGDAFVYYRAGNDHRIRVRALSTDDPKEMHPETSEQALFQGTYDFPQRKWTVTDARPVSFEESQNLSEAFTISEEGNSGSLEESLNEVYKGLRFLLPPDRFAKLKAEQLAWLKTREAARGEAEKLRLTRARLSALRDIAWGGVKEAP